VTEDRLLGGRVRFSQPAQGYRSAIDPVFLAAAVPAVAGERVLDAGSGTGAASLCLAARVPECRIVGLELQRELQRLASHNVEQNGFSQRVEMFEGDLDRPPPRVSGASFDHVMTNPPHLNAPAAIASPVGQRAAAHFEDELALANWLSACLRLLRPGGCLTLIHRADRIGDILAALLGKVGDLVIFPLWPGPEHRPAKRLLVQGSKGLRGPPRLARGLVLHDRSGGFSADAEGILRHGRALDLRAPLGPLGNG
jgi:tRNA1(Val) A37 N6-methylase TrmN6